LLRSFRGNPSDFCQHTAQVAEDIIIPETNYVDSLGREPASSSSISDLFAFFRVLAAIKLDAQLERGAIEIERIRPNGVLTSKV
jgi:hypothetical protein